VHIHRHHHNELFDDKDGPYAFHGTRSTLEILKSGYLQASYSMNGHGIYFGRRYQDSEPYAGDESSSYGDSDNPVRSVFVFDKKKQSIFESEDIGQGGSTQAYVITTQDRYDLTNLKAIVFMDMVDVEAFDDYYANCDAETKQWLDTITYYNAKYIPDFRAAFHGARMKILKDIHLLIWVIHGGAPQGFNMSEDELILLAKLNTPWDSSVFQDIIAATLKLTPEFAENVLNFLPLSPSEWADAITWMASPTHWSPLRSIYLSNVKNVGKLFDKVRGDPVAFTRVDAWLTQHIEKTQRLKPEMRDLLMTLPLVAKILL